MHARVHSIEQQQTIDQKPHILLIIADDGIGTLDLWEDMTTMHQTCCLWN